MLTPPSGCSHPPLDSYTPPCLKDGAAGQLAGVPTGGLAPAATDRRPGTTRWAPPGVPRACVGAGPGSRHPHATHRTDRDVPSRCSGPLGPGRLYTNPPNLLY
ncbi:hypothetical protein N7535_008840 [Penicillium sp. DV-2018c]|nr:hypothetical protein N7535_008840 [Penicillium sp. DV-2018c]